MWNRNQASARPASGHDGKVADHYSISGEIVPSLTVAVEPGLDLHFEPRTLLWKDPSIGVAMRSMGGMIGRAMAGTSLLLAETSGSGRIALSREVPGQIISVHLGLGESVDIREGCFLGCTSALEIGIKSNKGLGNILFGGSGLFLATVEATKAPGVLWLHGAGNVVEHNLAPGQSVDVVTGGWLYKEPKVRMDTVMAGLGTALFGSGDLALHRFTGPGLVAVQTLFRSQAPKSE